VSLFAYPHMGAPGSLPNSMATVPGKVEMTPDPAESCKLLWVRYFRMPEPWRHSENMDINADDSLQNIILVVPKELIHYYLSYADPDPPEL